MANPYLSVVESLGTPAERDNKYLDILEQGQAERDSRLRASISTALQTNPDQYAKARALGAETGLPSAVVERNLPAVDQRVTANKYTDLLADSPGLAGKMRDVEFAKVAHDDVETLSAIERTIKSLAGGTFRLAGGFWALPEIAGRAVNKYMPGGEGEDLDPITQYFVDARRAATGTADQLAKESRQGAGFVESSIYSGVESLAMNVPALVAGVVTKNPQVALAMLTSSVGGGETARAIDAGKSLEQATVYGMSQAAIEYATEQIPVLKLFDDLANDTGFLRMLTGNLWRENVTEQAATALQDLNEWAVLNPEKPFVDYLRERPEAALATAIATTVASGGQVSATFAADKGMRAIERRQYEAAVAERTRVIGERLIELGNQSKLAQRDPAAFEEAVAAASDGGEVTDVYIDAQKFGELYQESLPAALEEIGVTQEEYAQAAATGGDLKVAIPKFAARLATKPEAKQLLDHIKFSEDGYTPAQAKEEQKNLEAEMATEAERIIGEQADQEAWRQSAEVVKQDVRAKISQASGFRADVNDSYSTLVANFYTTLAGRLGVTPEEAYRQYGFNVANRQLPGIVLEQDRDLNGLLEEFGTMAESTFDAQKALSDGDRVFVFHEQDDQPTEIFDSESLGQWQADRIVILPRSAPQFDQGYFTVERDDETARVEMKQQPDGTYAWAVTMPDGRELGTFEDVPTAARAAQRELGPGAVFNQGPRSSDTHVMGVQRGERKVGKRISGLTPAEEQAVQDGAKLLGVPYEEVFAVVRDTKLAHPRQAGWAPLTFVRVKLNDKGKPEYQWEIIPYAFNVGANGKALKPGTPEYQSRVNALSRRMVDNVLDVYERARKGDATAQKIIKQSGWYREMRARLRQEFGGLGDLFADLLGATSPNTPVRTNWDFAIDSLRRATRGDFDALIPQWEQWQQAVEREESGLRAWFDSQLQEGARLEAAAAVAKAELDAWVNDAKSRGQTKKAAGESDEFKAAKARIAELEKAASQFTINAIKKTDEYKSRYATLKAARELPANLMPTQDSGSYYGFNGKNVVYAMLDLWRVVREADPDIGRGGQAPKALNFSGNLIGFRDRATIDVWAARMLQRLAGLKRIPSMAESGVSGEMRADGSTTLAFGMGQGVFSRAASTIRVDPLMSQDEDLARLNDDDLQALVWFIEKEIWTKLDATSAAGEGGSFEFEANLAGTYQRTRVRDLRKIIDASPAKADVELAKTDITADQAGLGKSTKELKAELDAWVDDAKSRGQTKKAAKESPEYTERRQAIASLVDVERRVNQVLAARARIAQLAVDKVNALQDLKALERTVDRYQAGVSIQQSVETQGVDYVPTDADMAQLGNAVRTAIYEADPDNLVLASKALSTQGRYGSVERSLDLEVVAREGYDPRWMWRRILEAARDAKQDSTFMSRVLRAEETPDPTRHRPGMEIYFKSARSGAELEAILADLATAGVEFYTISVDGRVLPAAMAGEMPPAVGVRFQYIPEFDVRYGGMGEWAGRKPAEIATLMQAKADEMTDLGRALLLKVPDVTYAGQLWYDTEVRFAHEYQSTIDALPSRPAAEADRPAGSGAWAARPLGEALESAARQSEESERRAAESGDAALGNAELNQSAHHGSPHLFVRFDLAKIGTGEGAQMYGWGIYFADKDKVALTYARPEDRDPSTATANVTMEWLTSFGENNNLPIPKSTDDIVGMLRGEYPNGHWLWKAEPIIKALQEDAEGRRLIDEFFAIHKDEAARYTQAWDSAYGALYNKVNELSPEGHLYRVDMPDDIVPRLLDWDAPLSEQPDAVKKALIFEVVKDTEPSDSKWVLKLNGEIINGFDTRKEALMSIRESTGAQFYRSLSAGQSQRYASELLQSAGIPGIKYFDGDSRAAQEGTRNYVIWDQQVLDQISDSMERLFQPNRGSFNPTTRTITLLADADLSTFLHEFGHFQLEILAEIAGQPNAPAAIVEDVNTLLKWFGVKDLATWNAMSLEEKRPHHETFARGFEAYLFHGEAPNAELRGIFARFRSWLVNLYQSLKSLNVKLTPEVTAVFDRMLASEESIKAAQATAGFRAVFQSAEEAGMTEEQWAAYQALGQQSTEDAARDLERKSLKDMQWLANAKARELKKLQQKHDALRKGIEAEVRNEVLAQPVYALMHFLRTGQIPENFPLGRAQQKVALEAGLVGNKLSLTDLRAELGESPAAPWRYLSSAYTAKDGLPPQMAAEIFGFTSVDHMVKSIIGAEPIDSVVEGLTDKRMLEEHGELSDPKAVERAAEAAIHNQARAKFIAAELEALQKALEAKAPAGTDKRGRKRSVNLLVKAAKDYAEAAVARMSVRDVRSPHRYAVAEGKAARAAEKAVRAGKLAEAAMAKRSEMLSHALYRATAKAGEEVDKTLEYFKKFLSKGSRESIDPEYLEQIDSILEGLDLRQASAKELEKRKSLAEWIAAQQELGIEPVLDPALVDATKRTHFSQLTVEQMRGLRDAIKNIEHLGRLKKKLLTAKDQREFDAIVDGLVESVEKHAGGREVNNRTGTTAGDRAVRLFKGFFASHRKMASLARQMDGSKDGGAMWESFIRSMNEAGDRETTMREQATVKLVELVKMLKGGERMGGKGQRIDAVNRSMNREQRIAVALNVGNAGNRQRLMSGENWSESQLQAVLDTLTQEDWNFVQSVWDLFETYRPQIAEKEKRVNGVEPEWIEPTPVMTKFGELRGGYYPIKYDPRASGRAEEHADAEEARSMLRAAYTSATTRRSFTKHRAEEVVERPLMLSLDGIYQGLNEVIHDLSWHEWLIDATRLLKNKRLNNAMRTAWGADIVQQFKKAMEDIGRGDAGAQGSFEHVLNHIRIGSTVVGLGWNVTTSLLQPLGLSQSIVRIGGKWVMRGLMRWVHEPRAALTEIYGKSEFMRVRAKTMQREINEVRNQVADKSKFRNATEASFFLLITKLQLIADVPTWLGAYEKAIVNGEAEDRATALADQAVIDSQGGGQIKDLAAIQRGGPALKLFTNFYSYFNVTYNLAAERARATEFRKPGQVAALAVDYLLLFVVPAVLGSLIKVAISGDDEDEDELARRLIGEQISYLMGTFVGLREATGAVQYVTGTKVIPTTYGGPAGLRLLTELEKLGKQVEQGEVDMPLIRAGANVAGIVLHLPTGQVIRTVEGATALIEGQTDNPAVLVSGYR